MMDNDDDRIDFSALDSTVDSDRLDRAVSGIMEGARFELARRRKVGDLVRYLGQWQRPMAAAAVVAVLVTYSVVSTPAPTVDPVAEAFNDHLGLPTEVAAWVTAETPPAAEEILFLSEEGAP
jgi:hypothetical protein